MAELILLPTFMLLVNIAKSILTTELVKFLYSVGVWVVIASVLSTGHHFTEVAVTILRIVFLYSIFMSGFYADRIYRS